jgi:hypothetical protein
MHLFWDDLPFDCAVCPVCPHSTQILVHLLEFLVCAMLWLAVQCELP